MNEKLDSEILTIPRRKVIITSAMRTGSTWITSVFGDILGCVPIYIDSVDEIVRHTEFDKQCVIKTHSLTDSNWDRIPADVAVLRLIRNFKDSLISRIFYVKYTRYLNNLSVDEPEIRDLLHSNSTLGDKEFVSKIIDARSCIKKWLAEIVLRERSKTEVGVTIMYETLLHNAMDTLLEVVNCWWPDWDEGKLRAIRAVRTSYNQSMHSQKLFVPLGVGGWQHLLTYEQSCWLEDLYYKMRHAASEFSEVSAAHELCRVSSIAEL